MDKSVKKIIAKYTDRRQQVGATGEYIAEILLKKKRFKKVTNLNNVKKNMAFADIYAERDNQAYVISVKARNKYEQDGTTLNSRYKLNGYKFAPTAELEHKAKAAWVTIALDIDNKTYDAYFGLLSSLMGNKGVPMTDEATREYERLADCEKAKDIGIKEEDYIKLSNKKSR